MMHILLIVVAAVLGPNMADDGYYYVDTQLDAYRMCLDLEDSAECLNWARDDYR